MFNRSIVLEEYILDHLKLVCCGCANAVNHAKDMMASKDTIESVAELFKLCGDSTRAAILCALCHHELCVCDLASVVGMSSSAVSHQLRLLKQNGIVASRRDGKEMIYFIENKHVEEIFNFAIKYTEECNV